jgi:hypothetical protein
MPQGLDARVRHRSEPAEGTHSIRPPACPWQLDLGLGLLLSMVGCPRPSTE